MPVLTASRRILILSKSYIKSPHTAQISHCLLLFQSQSLPTMRYVHTNTGANAKKNNVGGGTASTNWMRFGTFAVATTASYYIATTMLFSSIAPISADVVDTDQEGGMYKMEKKRDENYGVEYLGFDSYPGVHLDDGSGVATKEVKAASVQVVSRALDAAGLDETGMLKNSLPDGGEHDITIHPKHAHRIGLGKACPIYNCPFLPLDVHYGEGVKAQLENMRKEKPVPDIEKENLLNSSGSVKAATLTLIGYKGGKPEHQINQDRAIAIAPFLYHKINSSSKSEDTATRPVVRVIGAFDGHAKFGEKVSEYVVKTLPALLGNKLAEYDDKVSKEINSVDEQQRDQDISHILHETFLELDASSPADPSGGCTASVVLQLGSKIYLANAGDSRSFVAVHIKHQGENKGTIIFGTREDKPHLATERDRVEHMGGTVYLPNGFLESGKGTTRVIFQDPTTGSSSGLAMSRSIGDWDAGEVGVIPDPLIDILDIKRRVVDNVNQSCEDGTDEVEIDPASGEATSSKGQCVRITEKDVKVFAISATDGLLDYLPEQAIVNHVSKGLYETTAEDSSSAEQLSHPLLVCEDLIYAAAQGWQEDKGGRYRDDIAISVVDLELKE